MTTRHCDGPGCETSYKTIHDGIQVMLPSWFFLATGHEGAPHWVFCSKGCLAKWLDA